MFPVPPVDDALMLVLCPVQIVVFPLVVTESAGLTFTVIVSDPEQPLEFVTVTV